MNLTSNMTAKQREPTKPIMKSTRQVFISYNSVLFSRFLTNGERNNLLYGNFDNINRANTQAHVKNLESAHVQNFISCLTCITYTRKRMSRRMHSYIYATLLKHLHILIVPQMACICSLLACSFSVLKPQFHKTGAEVVGYEYRYLW